MGSTIPVCSIAWRKALTCSGKSGGAFHWLLFLVKSCTVWKPMAYAAVTARSQPPAIDMWAPNLQGFFLLVERALRGLAMGFSILTVLWHFVRDARQPSLASPREAILE